MFDQTLEILQKTKKLLGDQSNWFETVAQWYKKTTLPRKIIADLLQSERAQDRLLLHVNDQLLSAISGVTDSAGRRVTWLLPSNRLRQGNNNVVVVLDKRSNVSLSLRGVSLEQDYHVPWQTMSLMVREPAPAANLALANHKLVYYTGRHWSVEPGGLLQFNLALSQTGPVNFTLHLAEGRAGVWQAILRDIADEIRKEIRAALKEKLWELKEQLLRAWKKGDPRLKGLEEEYETLSAYQRLHQLHIEPALEGPPDGTLEEVIQQTASPMELIRDLVGGGPTNGTPGVPRDEPQFVKPARPAPAPEQLPQAMPARQAPPPPPVSRRPPMRRGPRSSSSAGSCLTVLFVLALVVAGIVGVVIWQFDAIKEWADGKGGQKGNRGAAAGQKIADILKAKGANKGEVQISLYWATKNDLDLHVVPPSNQEIGFFNRLSKCGGKLDVDMNVSYAAAAPEAVENIYWPEGKAPLGNYKIYVEHFNNHGKADCPNVVPFTIRVVTRGETQFFTGEVVFNDANRQRVLVHEFTLK